MGIKEKLPLINSDKKGIRMAGYIIYAFIFLNVLGAILPPPNSSETEAGSIKDQSAEVVPNTVDEWYTAAVSIDPQNEVVSLFHVVRSGTATNIISSFIVQI